MGMTQNWIQRCEDPVLEIWKVWSYISVAIIPKPTLIQNSSTCEGLIYESNRPLKIISIRSEYLKPDN